MCVFVVHMHFVYRYAETNPTKLPSNATTLGTSVHGMRVSGYAMLGLCSVHRLSISVGNYMYPPACNEPPLRKSNI